MTLTETEREALRRAFVLAACGPGHGANPQVGAVILDADGRVIGEGWHHGAGTLHAEPEALNNVPEQLRSRIAGGTAVVTLEPCNHTGRTPPCSRTLAAAGLARVVYALPDPNPTAGGGGAWLTEHGVAVQRATPEDWATPDLEQQQVITDVVTRVRQWATAFRLGRPYVIAKIASTLDGRSAAADGSSQWITSSTAREHAHQLRAEVDAILVGSQTVRIDDPALTARKPDGTLADHQPLRVVVGERGIPAGARLAGGIGVIEERTHDLVAVLNRLAEREVRRVLIEGGPTLVAAALRAGIVDQLNAYLAPALLGAGLPAVADLGITGIDHALRLRTGSVQRLGDDVLIIAHQGDN